MLGAPPVDPILQIEYELLFDRVARPVHRCRRVREFVSLEIDQWPIHRQSTMERSAQRKSWQPLVVARVAIFQIDEHHLQ